MGAGLIFFWRVLACLIGNITSGSSLSPGLDDALTHELMDIGEEDSHSSYHPSVPPSDRKLGGKDKIMWVVVDGGDFGIL